MARRVRVGHGSLAQCPRLAGHQTAPDLPGKRVQRGQAQSEGSRIVRRHIIRGGPVADSLRRPGRQSTARQLRRYDTAGGAARDDIALTHQQGVAGIRGAARDTQLACEGARGRKALAGAQCPGGDGVADALVDLPMNRQRRGAIQHEAVGQQWAGAWHGPA